MPLTMSLSLIRVSMQAALAPATPRTGRLLSVKPISFLPRLCRQETTTTGESGFSCAKKMDYFSAQESQLQIAIEGISGPE